MSCDLGFWLGGLQGIISLYSPLGPAGIILGPIIQDYIKMKTDRRTSQKG